MEQLSFPRVASMMWCYAAVTLGGDVSAQEPAGEPEGWLGYVDFPTSCTTATRTEINRGVALLHHMTYPRAQAAFERVTELDAGCAIGYWGVAMTKFQPLWPTRPSAVDLDAGWAAVQAALSAGAGTERERLYVATAAAFFDPAGSPDYWTRIDRWAASTAALYEAYPDDLDAAALFALSLLATVPLQAEPAASHRRAAEILQLVHREQPTHPGAVHYTIHANDFDGREREASTIVRSYGAIAPRNPHALHMPTHIFVRLGGWAEVIDWNEQAAEAALEQRVGEGGQWVWDEFPHAVEYLVYGHLQRGDDARAEQLIRTLEQTPDLQPSFKTAFHLASTAARYALERRDWSAATRLVPRTPGSLDWDLFPWPEAVTVFARGMGAVHRADSVLARESEMRLRVLHGRAQASDEEIFARSIQVLLLELEAWRAHAEGDDRRALNLMREASALERSTPKHAVTPAPTIPADELLGDLLLEIGDAAAALEAYELSFEHTPGRFNGLLGAARAAAASGDRTKAESYYTRLLESAATGSTREGLAAARAYLAGR